MEVSWYLNGLLRLQWINIFSSLQSSTSRKYLTLFASQLLFYEMKPNSGLSFVIQTYLFSTKTYISVDHMKTQYRKLHKAKRGTALLLSLHKTLEETVLAFKRYISNDMTRSVAGYFELIMQSM